MMDESACLQPTRIKYPVRKVESTSATDQQDPVLCSVELLPKLHFKIVTKKNSGNMLKIKSPLPIISEALGHQSVNTTSIYLKIDIDGLRKCALDPEEVFANENSL